jgi:hypothetical protein
MIDWIEHWMKSKKRARTSCGASGACRDLWVFAGHEPPQRCE